MNMKTTSELIREAREILDVRGHAKGDLEDKQGRVCIAGALNIATVGFADLVTYPPVRAEAGWLVRVTARAGSLVAWNDAPMRTKQEVLDALDAAYVLALQEEGKEPEDVL